MTFVADTFLKNAPEQPGVYRMLDIKSEILYVGKAKNLKKRLSSYFKNHQLTPKTQALVKQITAIEITITHTEDEALLLESNLIKRHQPKYNVLLRDDKSYPYLVISQHDYPKLSFYRGPRKKSKTYFGPYPNAQAARDSISLLQKLFLLRNCEDSVFNNRTRPCLEYQIKRCSAPCVGFINKILYQQDVASAVLFLQGKNQQAIGTLVEKMEQASQALAFEQAAHFRDQIQQLRKVSAEQAINSIEGDCDIIAGLVMQDICCIQVFIVRQGQMLGQQTFYPSLPETMAIEIVLESFLPQYYLERTIPKEVIVSQALENKQWLENALSQLAGYKVTLTTHKVRQQRARWLEMALYNVKQAVATKLQSVEYYQQQWEALIEALHLAKKLERIECFDISHTHGQSTVGSCVVFDNAGPMKSSYRRYHIDDITPGDDYAAISQVMQRRFQRMIKEERICPDMILIDGGKGQVKQAKQILAELTLDIPLFGIVKDASRKEGLEIILTKDYEEIHLDKNNPALHLLIQIRNEAHRFAITGGRLRHKKTSIRSSLEGILGLGSKKRQLLLHYFGGIEAIKKAGILDLMKVPGIGKQLAENIYHHFHG